MILIRQGEELRTCYPSPTEIKTYLLRYTYDLQDKVKVRSRCYLRMIYEWLSNGGYGANTEQVDLMRR